MGTRLDHFLRDQDLSITRSQIKKIIDGGWATIDDKVARPAEKIKEGQVVILRVPPPEPLSVEPENIPLEVIFEDDDVVVVNKPQGLVVHPAPGHPTGTLVNALLYNRQAAGGHPLRPGIVHRLDKDTSGVMVVAKNDRAHAELARQFHVHSVARRYKVLVRGAPPDRGEWRTLHGRSSRDRKRFTSRVTRGKEAISQFETKQRFSIGASLLEVTLRTGRTHQVRVHCHDHGYPVLGDRCYGAQKLGDSLKKIHESLPGQALHAELLGFVHPTSGEPLRFQVDPPRCFCNALESLQNLSMDRE